MITYLHLPPEYTFEHTLPVFVPTPHRCVIISEADVSTDWMNHVSAWLIDHECAYAMTWGKQCEIWHDALDWAHLDRHRSRENVSDERHIMTTWHDNETLDEVFWFAGNCANLTDKKIDTTVLCHIAHIPDESGMLTRYEQAQTIGIDEI